MGKNQLLMVCVKVVVFAVSRDKLRVLLCKSKGSKETWELPGEGISTQKTIDDAAVSVFVRYAKTKKAYIEQLYTFDKFAVGKKGIGGIDIGFMALVEEETVRDDNLQMWETGKLPKMEKDDKEMINMGVSRLRNKLEYTNIAFSLMGREFSLSQLQKLYEIVWAKKLDKRNFYRKIKSGGMLKTSGDKKRGGAHRPAQMFSFRKNYLEVLEIL